MKTLYDHGQVYTGQLPLASAFVVEGLLSRCGKSGGSGEVCG